MAKVIIRPYTDEEKSVTGTDGACVVIPAPNFLATLPKEWSEEISNKDKLLSTNWELLEHEKVNIKVKKSIIWINFIKILFKS